MVLQFGGVLLVGGATGPRIMTRIVQSLLEDLLGATNKDRGIGAITSSIQSFIPMMRGGLALRCNIRWTCRWLFIRGFGH
jgi:hypothetical protein